jgi:hypothetical protein
MEVKPHKGSIKNWRRLPCHQGIGFYITGIFVDHPQFAELYGHTSWVVKYDPSTGEIETRNSHYTLVGEGRHEPL